MTAGPAWRWQTAWAVLAALWNIGGVAAIAQGGRSPGPTASLAAGVLLLIMAAGFRTLAMRWRWPYVAVSAVALLFGGAAVYNAMTADPALWPSEGWRIAGIVLNCGGVLAGLVGINWALRQRSDSPA